MPNVGNIKFNNDKYLVYGATDWRLVDSDSIDQNCTFLKFSIHDVSFELGQDQYGVYLELDRQKKITYRDTEEILEHLREYLNENFIKNHIEKKFFEVM